MVSSELIFKWVLHDQKNIELQNSENRQQSLTCFPTVWEMQTLQISGQK